MDGRWSSFPGTNDRPHGDVVLPRQQPSHRQFSPSCRVSTAGRRRSTDGAAPAPANINLSATLRPTDHLEQANGARRWLDVDVPTGNKAGFTASASASRDYTFTSHGPTAIGQYVQTPDSTG